MILELNDIEIILRKASDEEKQSIPVWDAYIEKVIIDGNIPSLLRDKLTGKINNLTQGFTQKFSGQLKGNIENEILSLEEYVYRKHDLTLAFIIMALTIFWLWNRNSELRHDLKNSTEQPDTIWVNKPFVPKVEFPKIQLPKMVFLYQIDSVPIERIEYVDRVVTIVQKDSTKIEYNELFLTNYPMAPKLLQILSGM